MRIGQITATPIVEIECQQFPAAMLVEVADPVVLAREEAWAQPAFYDRAQQAFRMSTHSWLLDTGRHRILVDPCVGNFKPRRVFGFYDMLDTPYLERLQAAGAAPGEIDFVFCTHLHVDHCGWNTRLVDGRWVPTFPNARYLFSRREHDYWQAHDTYVPGMDTSLEVNVGVFADSVRPVVEAGLAQLVDDAPVEIAACLTVEASPGHTAGHLFGTLRSGGTGAVFAGDALHHPIQVHYPDWNTSGSFDPVQARQSRRRILGRCADEGLWLAAAHFMAPHAVRVQRDGSAFRIA
ncbi:MAG: MBL fold metallo-hydrolase [Gammaproteobacteria bacterium]